MTMKHSKRRRALFFISCIVSFLFPGIEAKKKFSKKPSEYAYNDNGRKRIVIAWSKGGGAHKSMLDALKDYLSDEYDIIAYNPLEKIWCKFDPVKVVTLGYMDGEDFYNCLLSWDKRWLINKCFCYGTSSMRRHTRYVENQLVKFLIECKPHLVISVIPVFNYALNEASRRLNIPFLMVTPDCDTTHYLTDMYPSRPFYCTLPFNDELLLEKARCAWIYPHYIKEFGFPLRLDFFEPKDEIRIRKDFNIPDAKPSIMVLMGATGSSKCLSYLKRLVEVDIPVHLIVCIGRNEGLRKTIERVVLPDHISMSIVGFTKRISDLMAVSHALITKAGATTVCEAIEMRVPLILDHVSTPLEIERMQPDLVKKQKLGIVLTSYNDLAGVIKRLVTDQEYRTGIRTRMERFSNKTFPRRIKSLIKRILERSEQEWATPEQGRVCDFRWLTPG